MTKGGSLPGSRCEHNRRPCGRGNFPVLLDSYLSLLRAFILAQWQLTNHPRSNRLLISLGFRRSRRRSRCSTFPFEKSGAIAILIVLSIWRDFISRPQADNFWPALVFRPAAGQHGGLPSRFWKNRPTANEQHSAVPLLYVRNCYLVLFFRLSQPNLHDFLVQRRSLHQSLFPRADDPDCAMHQQYLAISDPIAHLSCLLPVFPGEGRSHTAPATGSSSFLS